MTTDAYYTWDDLGRPYWIAKPIAQMIAYCRKHDIPVLGAIGNTAHLTKRWPEDHTPYSYTAQPLKLPLVKPVEGQRYWVCACDLGESIGASILRDARAGKLPWLKYMNVSGKNYHAADGFKYGAPNNDQHTHLSCWTDELLTDISGYDPLNLEDNVTPADIAAIATAVEKKIFGHVIKGTATGDRPNRTFETVQSDVYKRVLAILTVVTDMGDEDVDEAKIATEVIAALSLTPEKIAAAIPAELAEDTANAILIRLGQLAEDEADPAPTTTTTTTTTTAPTARPVETVELPTPQEPTA